MSGPAYVVMPVQTGGAQQSEPDTAKIALAIQQSLHGEKASEDMNPDGREHTGPLKKAIMAHRDSLYKYISWESPMRTLGAYMAALCILLGAHFLPLTQWVLKAGVTILGVVSVTEFASRPFGPNTVLARLRPQEHYKVPESTLNATLKDIHDFVQYAVVQAQVIIFGHDLNKTFAAFLGLAALYWLMKIMSAFSLAVLALTLVFIAPLAASPRGREVAHDAMVRAEELGSAAAETGKSLAQDGKAKASELYSKGQDVAADAGRRVGDMAQSGKQAATSARDTASDYAAAAVENVKNLPEHAVRAKDATADMAGATAENAKKLPEQATNAMSKASGTATSALGDAKQYAKNSLSGASDGKAGGNGAVPEPASKHADVAVHVSSKPDYTGSEKTASTSDTRSGHVAAADREPAAPNVTLNLPRGTVVEAAGGA